MVGGFLSLPFSDKEAALQIVWPEVADAGVRTKNDCDAESVLLKSL